MRYNEYKNMLIYLILVMVCLTITVQIMVRQRIIVDPINKSVNRGVKQPRTNIINTQDNGTNIMLTITSNFVPNEKSMQGADVFINGEIHYENSLGVLEVNARNGDVLSIANKTAGMIKVTSNKYCLRTGDDPIPKNQVEIDREEETSYVIILR